MPVKRLAGGSKYFVNEYSIYFLIIAFILKGTVSVVELKQSSVMQRFLTGWMPTAIRLVSGDG